MNSVQCRNVPISLLSRVLLACFLVLILAACGTNSTATTSSSTQAHSGSTATKATTLSPSTSLDLNTANVNAKVGDLLVQSNTGFQCPYAQGIENSDFELGHLVLASDRTTYSQAEIAEMSAYLPHYVRSLMNETAPSGETEPPPTLRVVLGGAMDQVPGTPPALPQYPGKGCEALLTLSNTGNAPIQVSQVGVQLQAPPQPNTYKYRLIDACGLVINVCINPGSSGGGSCSVYYASIQLGMGKQNDVFSAVPTADTGCSVPTIAPGAQINLAMTFSPASNTPQNLIYSIVPVFTVDTTQGNQTVSVPQLGKTLAFANVSQFSCYGLQGTTFVLEKSPAFLLYAGPNPPPGKEHWCL
jgi:hypothetical protein